MGLQSPLKWELYRGAWQFARTAIRGSNRDRLLAQRRTADPPRLAAKRQTPDMTDGWEYKWVLVSPRHEYGDKILNEWGSGGWEVVNWAIRPSFFGWVFGGRGQAWALLKRSL